MPKFYDVVQGSERWSFLRMGRPTASDFDQIITPEGDVAKGKKVETYANRLVSEILLMRPIRTISPTYAMERGKNLEQEAGNAYKFAANQELASGGFFTDDLGHAGASPDARIIGFNRGLEIKCPLSEEKHMTYYYNPEELISEYIEQTQGQINRCGFECVDMISYYPELPRVITRVYPVQKYQDSINEAVLGLRDLMNEKIMRLVDDGHLDIDIFLEKQNSAQQETLLEII